MSVTDPPARLAYRVADLAQEVGLSRQTIYEEIRTGRLRAVKIRGRLLILADEARRWLTATGEAGQPATAAPRP